MKNRILVLLLITFFIPVNIYASKKDIFKYPYKVVSNRYFQKWGSTILFLLSQERDATADGVQFGGTYGASKDLWHLYKNQSKTYLMLSFGLKGLAVGQGHYTFRETTQRFIYECLLAWVIWHWRYRYVKYGTPFKFDAYANEHIIYLPTPFSDRDMYIGLQGWEVLTFDLVRLFVGIWGIINF